VSSFIHGEGSEDLLKPTRGEKGGERNKGRKKERAHALKKRGKRSQNIY
jgi:hypothetical protein